MTKTTVRYMCNLLAVLTLFVSTAYAATINAASCSTTDVNTAITGATTGDTVVLPSCSVSWTSAVTLNKSITLQGQTSCSGGGGANGSTIACTNNTTITFGASPGELIIAASNARVTGITFRGAGNGGNASMIEVTRGFTNWRFDHNDIQPTSQSSRCIYAYGGTGLFDHNHFKSCNDGIAIEGQTAGDSVDGDYMWSHTLSMNANSNMVFVEDNYFDYPTSEADGAVDTYNGASWSFRHNYVNGTNIGGHGLDSTTNGRSTMNIEAYNNTFINPRNTGNIYQVVDSRGGTWKVFNNIVSTANSAYGIFLWLHLYRSDASFSFGNNAICGATPTPNWIDGNIDHGYPCRDQQARGPETAPATDWPVRNSASPAPVYSEALFPGYSWLNTFQGARITGVLDPDIRVTNAANADPPTNASQFQIINNRDFYQDVGSAGTGTAGVGVGTLSQRPATCTVNTTPDGQTSGVGYWATDQGSWNQSGDGSGNGQLYVCTATNTWSLYYVPYTYPHPLQGGGGQVVHSKVSGRHSFSGNVVVH